VKKMSSVVCMLSAVFMVMFAAQDILADTKIVDDSAAAKSAATNAAKTDQPEMKRAEAIGKLKASNELTKRASAILASGSSRDILQTALNLYAQAGQGFQEAEAIFKALGPKYVPQEFVINSQKAMQVCLSRVKMLKAKLSNSK